MSIIGSNSSHKILYNGLICLLQFDLFLALSDWNETSFGSPSPYEQGKAGMILPIALHHLCPFYISLFGMGALAASVMSSVDSGLLCSASLLGRNIFKNIIYKKVSGGVFFLVLCNGSSISWTRLCVSILC